MFYNATTRECIKSEKCAYYRIDDPQFPTHYACLTDCTYFMQMPNGMMKCFDDTKCPGFYRDSDRKRVECLENASSCEFVSSNEYKKCISECERSPITVNGIRYCPDCNHTTSFTLNISNGEIVGLEHVTCTGNSFCSDSLKIGTLTCANVPTCMMNRQLFAQNSVEASTLWNLNGTCVSECGESDYRYESQCVTECPAETAAYQQTCMEMCPNNMIAKDRICVKQKLTKTAKIFVIIAAVIVGLLVVAGAIVGIWHYKKKKL